MRDGEEYPIMKRTTLVANTSNMPVAAREASIYTGITLSEYFRDQGYNVAMMSDSTSRWAEALREISVVWPKCLPIPVSQSLLGCQARLFLRACWSCCLSWFARARRLRLHRRCRIRLLSVTSRIQSLRLTLGIVGALWGLDKKLAQRKHFPSVNGMSRTPTTSTPLEPYYDKRTALASSRSVLLPRACFRRIGLGRNRAACR